MPYIIDGHNLIPKIPNLSLQLLDDEQQLIELLQEFCRVQRRQVEVYFDNAPPGGVRARNFGSVIAHFVRQDMTADQAIRRRLERLGRAAHNWTVVSSDLAVQAAGRSARARVLSSEEFASLLADALDENLRDQGEQTDSEELSADQLEDWLKLFGAQQDS